MKKYVSVALSVLMAFSALTFSACKDTDKQESSGDADATIAYRSEEKNNYMESIYLTDYVSALNEEETLAFAAEGKDRQTSAEQSIAISSYYSTKINGEDVYTYMIVTAETNPHSVVFMDVSADRFEGGKTLDVEITANFGVEKAVVLPEKLGITPEVGNQTVRFSVGGYGSYTVVVDDVTNPDKAYTLFVREPEKVEVPYGYTLVEYKPGLHFVDELTLKSNTVLYLHAGAFLVAKPKMEGEGQGAFIGASNVENVKIVGHGVVDMSQMGWHAGSGLAVINGKNIEIDGVTMLNASTWTMYYNNCENLTIKNCIIFGYRQNSDGYAICSSRNVKVVDSFARSGDDLFEVKSYTGAKSENILFENCVAWPDNCRGFGIIQETFSDINNVTYRNCSLLYQLNDWAEHMAAFVITAGECGNVSNLLFEDCDLFYSKVFALRFSIGENSETMGIKGFNNKITGVTFRNCDFKMPASTRGILKFRNATTDVNGISGVVFENVTFGGEKLTDLSSLNPVYEGEAPQDIVIK